MAKLARRDFLRLVGTSTVGALGAAYLPGARLVGAQSSGGTLQVPWHAFEVAYPMSGHRVAKLIYDRLLDLDVDGGLHPNLAESWEVSPDATTYTFHLRQGVQWHDGQPFGMNDVLYTIKWILNGGNTLTVGYHRLWGEIVGAAEFTAGTAAEISGLEVVDEQTLRVTLAGPDGGWLTTAVSQIEIIPEHVYSNIPLENVQEPHAPAWYQPETHVGTGPFKFVEAEDEGFVRLARNDTYWGGTPLLDGVLFKNVGEDETRFTALQKDELDFLQVTGDFYIQAADLPNVEVVTFNRPYSRYLQINLSKPYLQDVRVRQALSHAVDRQILCDTILAGLAEPWYSFVEYDAWLNQNMPTYPFDPAKAKELLDAAAQDGTWDPNTELELMFYYPGNQERNFMAGLQKLFADAGIKARIAFYETAASTTKVEEGDFDLVYSGFGAVPEPDNYAVVASCNDASAMFFHGAMTDLCVQMADLFSQGKALSDYNERKAIYDQIQQLYGEQALTVPLFRFKQAMAINQRVSGFGLGAQTMFTGWSFNHHEASKWSVTE